MFSIGLFFNTSISIALTRIALSLADALAFFLFNLQVARAASHCATSPSKLDTCSGVTIWKNERKKKRKKCTNELESAMKHEQ